VEACIALSIVLVAREALRPPSEPSLTRRAPWAVAGLFGLVHGLGFAGAMQATGLPAGSIGVALVGFNVGVELGQLAVVVAAVAIAWAADRARASAPARPVVVYALGALGAYWLIARTITIAG
jgi:hypothetical protein